jgi:RNase P/RNase MRP subunit POP5
LCHTIVEDLIIVRATVKYFSPATKLAIVRVSRQSHRTVWAALTFVRQLKGVECCIRVLHVGGALHRGPLSFALLT